MYDSSLSRALSIEAVEPLNGTGPTVPPRALLEEARRARLAAEQAAHAERMRRVELQEELARRRREETEADLLRVDLLAARERIRELSREHELLRREVAEAEHQAAIAWARASRDATDAERDQEGAAVAEPPDAVARSERPDAVARSEPETTLRVIEAHRLEDALSRLREAAPSPDPAEATQAPLQPAPAGKAWITPVFRAMVRRDPAGAGRVALALLAAQPSVQPLPLAYDLVLSDFGCVTVTAAGGRARVEIRDAPRRREEVQLVVRGELSSFARLLAAGPLRRLVWRRLARARGSRSTLAALRALIRAPLSLGQLRAAGVAPHPPLALSLIAAMIEPEWTTGEAFAIAHRPPEAPVADVCLWVRDGSRVVAGASGERGMLDDLAPRTTIVCPSSSLLAAFDLADGAEVSVEGDARPLAVVQSWVKRAQCG
jgi:hypothetical protein